MAWFYTGERGFFRYWPDGRDAPSVRHDNVWNTAVVGDNDFMHHQVERVGPVDAERIDGLTIDAALVVVKYAGTWKPWGALPWTWAYRAIEEVVWSGIGHNTTELEEWHQVGNRTPVGVPSPRSARIADVERLAEGRPELALFLEVLATEVSERDYGVVLEYELQKADGVRAPSETTALLTGLKAPNVRQVFRRSRKKLVRRIDADPGLEVLRGFWFLASSD